MSVTIKEVAKEAGVSVATVSRVLNKSATVSSATAKQVNEAICKLNYSPNFLGRNLRKCETNVILVVLPSTEQTYFSEVLRGMQDTANVLGYDIVIGLSCGSSERELTILNMLFNRTVDAAVLISTYLDVFTLNSLNENYNIALCSEKVKGANVLTVTVDNENAAYSAVEALIKKNHTKIGLISTNGKAMSSIDRESGYLKALKENGIKPRKDYIYYNTYDFRNGGYAFNYFMNLNDPPTAIFAVSDMLAMGAIKQAVISGYKVGKDIAIMGFDNISLSDLFLPSISTIAQPCYVMGKKVIEVLVNNINSKEKNCSNIIMPHHLILRQSTGD